MTSGNFTRFPLKDITVQREHRLRKTITQADIDSLAESIARLGLINPITIKRDGELIAGETRYLAHKQLGLSEINVQFVEDLDEVTIKEIELEENVKRKDVSWQDQCLFISQLHDLHKEHDPDWTVANTAESIGYSPDTITVNLQVAREILSGNEAVKTADKFSTARGLTVRKRERAQADELAVMDMATPPGQAPISDAPIFNIDFNEWAPTYDGQPFNFIHCDFPYGIGADKFDQGAGVALGGYEDKFDTYARLIDTLIENRERLLGSSGHVLFWFSMKYYQYTLERLKQVFWIDEYPLIWSKVGQGTLPNPEMGPRRTYEVAFLCSHGNRKIIRAVSNVAVYPIERAGDHMSEKSQRMLEDFFRMIVDSQTRMLDPTCGSGSALRAADALGAKQLVGLEVNPDFCKLAKLAWEKRNA